MRQEAPIRAQLVADHTHERQNSLVDFQAGMGASVRTRPLSLGELSSRCRSCPQLHRLRAEVTAFGHGPLARRVLPQQWQKMFQRYVPFVWYNFCRVHQTLRVTPAMEAGISSHVWSLAEIVWLLDAADKKAA